jgi:NADPH:quinone reductase-like Zn-dependent oxidoreductase
MKVVEIRGGFGSENLVVAERPDPEPGPGQIVLRMRAVSLNYRDLLTVRGHYNPKQPLPLIPCSDGVGEVAAVGEGVTRVQTGDRVAPIFAQRWLSGEPTKEKLRSTLGGPLDGTLAESMLLDESGVVHVPEHLDDEEAATLPCAAVTAWSAMVVNGSVRAGDTVLVQGTGGVSVFALQLGRLLGARVIVTSSSDEKLERAIELGAWAGINYKRQPEWGKEVRRLTGGEGVDHVVEVGGAGTLAESLTAIRAGGQISVIGVLSGTSGKINVIPVLMGQVRIQGVLVGHREGFDSMNRAIGLHRMHPVIDRRFGFEEVPAALEHMAAGRHFGKICVRIRDAA